MNCLQIVRKMRIAHVDFVFAMKATNELPAQMCTLEYSHSFIISDFHVEILVFTVVCKPVTVVERCVQKMRFVYMMMFRMFIIVRAPKDLSVMDCTVASWFRHHAMLKTIVDFMLNANQTKTVHTNVLAIQVTTAMVSFAWKRLIAKIHENYVTNRDIASKHQLDFNVFAMVVCTQESNLNYSEDKNTLNKIVLRFYKKVTSATDLFVWNHSDKSMHFCC